MALHRLSSKLTINGSRTFINNAWLQRGFVSATAPSHKAKIDKETCEKVIETTEKVKDVVKEVKRAGEDIAGKLTNATGNMAADAAKEGLQRAAQTAESKKSKDLLDTAKVAAEAVKEKVDKKDK